MHQYQPDVQITMAQQQRRALDSIGHGNIPKSGSPIESAFSRTRMALEAMDERIADLEKRLHPVLAPANDPIKGGGACAEDGPPIAPMQENVDAITTAVLRHSNRLRDLLDYLQL